MALKGICLAVYRQNCMWGKRIAAHTYWAPHARSMAKYYCHDEPKRFTEIVWANSTLEDTNDNKRMTIYQTWSGNISTPDPSTYQKLAPSSGYIIQRPSRLSMSRMSQFDNGSRKCWKNHQMNGVRPGIVGEMLISSSRI